MLSRSLTTPLASRAATAFQLAAALALALGSLALALFGAPLAPAPASGGLGRLVSGLAAPAQGLPAAAAPQGWAWLNPGADLDASVSTDGEDLAAPVADIAEFRSKDAFLAVDALFGGTMALNAGLAGGSAALATALAQDHV